MLVLAEGRLMNLGCDRPPQFRDEFIVHEPDDAQLDLWLNAQGKPTLSGIKYQKGEVYTLPKKLDEEGHGCTWTSSACD